MSATPSMIQAGDERTPGLRRSGSHGSLQSYVIGYVVAMVLTAVSFWLAKSPLITPSSATAAVVVLAIAQMLVHLIFFLHINTSPEHKANIWAFVLTVVIIFLIVIGSMWIMASLNRNMMPMDQVISAQR